MRPKLGELKRSLYFTGQRYFGRVGFIHINKCGGTTIESMLKIPKIHDTAKNRIEKIGRKAWQRMTTFTIIRHPYTRVVSHFNYRKRMGRTEADGRELGLNEWIYRSYYENEPTLYDVPLMFSPCFQWIATPDEGVLVDHVLRLETLEETWPVFRKKYDLPALPSRKNVTLSTDLATALEAMNSKSISIVNEIFYEDFIAFDYDMAD